MNRVKVAFWCRIMEVTLLTCLIFTPLLGQVIFWLSRGVPTGGTIEVAIGTITYECDSFNLCTTNNIVPFITYLCGDLIICLILWQLYKIFNNIRHKNIFSPQILKHIYCAGYFLILLSVYYIITDILIYLLQAPGGNIEYEFEFGHLFYLPVGIGLIILGYILKLAVEMKKEQDLVI